MESSNSKSERYAELSRSFIEKANEYLRAGDRVQASGKGWGAVAKATKSIARQRNRWRRLTAELLRLGAEPGTSE